jgi:hypothetical protein
VRESSNAPNPYGDSWLSTWWLWESFPVKKLARAGQHNGLGANELRNVSPVRAIWRRVCGIHRRSSARMSSAVMTRRLG